MNWQLFLSIAAGSIVVIALLFLSLIHLFMIPKDVMDRDTGKLKERREGEDSMSQDRDQEIEKPEVPNVPELSPEMPDTKGPKPEEPSDQPESEPESPGSPEHRV